MKVAYLGDKNDMMSKGYDFSNGKTVDVPETDTFAIRKFLGNGHFRCDHVDNFELPDQREQKDEIPEPKALSKSEQKEIAIGVFKIQQDGNPYSRPEKVFRGTYEKGLKLDALEWMQGKGLQPGDRLLMVK